jgi:AraC-like DNA-binding protein
MEALSAALNAVRVSSAIYFNAECRAPWGFAVPALSTVSRLLAPGIDRLVNFHLVTDGDARVSLAGMPDLAIRAGDVVVLPHADAHEVSAGMAPTLVNSRDVLSKIVAGDLTPMRVGGNGPVTRFICGFFGCHRHAERLFLAGLPRVIQLNVRDDAKGAWIEDAIRRLVDEAASGRPGNAALLSRMAEALFVEVLRRHAEESPATKGWLAAARDPVAGAALKRLHLAPARQWTTDSLARDIGVSRSVLAERFAGFMGEGPTSYLIRWRLDLAAGLLASTHGTIAQVAAETGYKSEAAFNRAFRRQFGDPPAKYRRERVGADGPRAQGKKLAKHGPAVRATSV